MQAIENLLHTIIKFYFSKYHSLRESEGGEGSGTEQGHAPRPDHPEPTTRSDQETAKDTQPFHLQGVRFPKTEDETGGSGVARLWGQAKI